MAIVGLILLIILIAGILGVIASFITEDEKEIYQKYFRWFLIVLLVSIPLVIFFLEVNSFYIILFLFFLILCWQYSDKILKFLGIKRKRK